MWKAQDTFLMVFNSKNKGGIPPEFFGFVCLNQKRWLVMIGDDGRNFIDYVMYTAKIKTQRIQRSMPEPVGSPAVTESCGK